MATPPPRPPVHIPRDRKINPATELGLRDERHMNSNLLQDNHEFNSLFGHRSSVPEKNFGKRIHLIKKLCYFQERSKLLRLGGTTSELHE